MGVHEEVPDRGLAQQLVDARHVAALREPHAARATPEVPLVEIGRHVNLGAQRRPVAIEERKEGVGGGGGDDLQPARLLEAPERADQVPLVGAPGVANRLEAIPVHLGQTMVVRLGSGPVELLLAELDQPVEVAGIALLQEVVGEHRDERRRERDGAAVWDAVGDEPLEHLQERQVRSGDPLVEPLLLHHRRVLGMPDERQVGVEDQREIPGRHRAHPFGDGSAGYRGRFSLAPAHARSLAPGYSRSLAPA